MGHGGVHAKWMRSVRLECGEERPKPLHDQGALVVGERLERPEKRMPGGCAPSTCLAVPLGCDRHVNQTGIAFISVFTNDPQTGKPCNQD